jgi:mannosyltransferase OCH1-like enzyme
MWWDQLTLEPSIQTNKVIPPLTIWGQPLELAAHRSDIIRLYALKAMGGVYLDLDVFVYVHLHLLSFIVQSKHRISRDTRDNGE